MEIDQGKVSVISKFLEESFIGCSVYDRQDADRDAQFFRVVDETSGKVTHRVFVSRAFLDDHGAEHIIPAPGGTGLPRVSENRGRPSVIVKSQMIEIEKGIARDDVDPRDSWRRRRLRSSESAIDRIAQPALHLHRSLVGQLHGQRRLEPRHAARQAKVNDKSAAVERAAMALSANE
jgi:hypothetical protein